MSVLFQYNNQRLMQHRLKNNTRWVKVRFNKLLSCIRGERALPPPPYGVAQKWDGQCQNVTNQSLSPQSSCQSVFGQPKLLHKFKLTVCVCECYINTKIRALIYPLPYCEGQLEGQLGSRMPSGPSGGGG